MAAMVSGLQRLGIQFGAVFWFALLIFGLLGLGVIYVLPWWMLALIVVTGIIIGLITYFPRWFLRRKNPPSRRKEQCWRIWSEVCLQR